MKKLKDLPILIFKAIIKTIMDVIGIPVIAIALLFTKKESEHLPHWAWPWCNEHDSINGYSNTNHWEKTWGTEPKTGVRTYWARFRWCAIRNRSENFTRFLGVKELNDRLNIRYPIKLWKDIYLTFKLGYTHGKPGTTWYNHISDKHHFKFSIDIRKEK